jgi:sialidase-1
VFTRSHGEDLEKQIVTNASKERTRVLVMSSADSGKTWSPPTDISATCRKPEWTWYGIGSGIGIQLKNGRLVVPAYHTVEKTMDFTSHMIISDDQGKTWRLGGDVGGMTGECQVAERRDGTLQINARNQQGQNWHTTPFGTNPPPEGKQYNERLIAESKDGGDTWGKVTTDPSLHEPICQAIVYSWPTTGNEKPLWLFSNPAGPKRRNLTIRASHDEGRTWPIAKTLHDGGSEYSCLTRLPDGTVGCIYERWQDNNIRIYWARFPLSWLK